VSRQNGAPAVPECLEAFGGATLLGVVVAEERETVVVQPAREVGDVDAEDEITDLDGLVPWRVAWRHEQEDRAVAEKVVVAVDQFNRPSGAGVVARAIEVPLDGGVVVPGCPLGALDHDRHRVGNQRQAAGVVPMQMAEHDLGDRRQVDLVGDALILFQREGPDSLRTPVVAVRVAGGRGVEARVDEDALGVRLDQIDRHRIADRLVHGVARSKKACGGREPSGVEHLDLHVPDDGYQRFACGCRGLAGYEGYAALRTSDSQFTIRFVAPSRRQVVLVGFDGMQLLNLVGPAEMLDAATQVLGGERGYRVVIATPDGTPVRGSAGMRLAADRSLNHVRPRAVDTMIVGGGMRIAEVTGDPRLASGLQRISAGARRTCSVCTGAFLLASAGLLDGRAATTHWAFCAELARRHPRVRVEPDRIFVRDGATLTSAGSTAGMDLTLALIEEDHGPDVARTVARWTVMFLQRPGGQSQFSERLALPGTVASPIRQLLDAIVAEPADDHRLARLAKRAAVSERHLRRMFAEQTGTTPGRFVERIRVEAAREQLESTGRPIKTVAAACGFGSPETMRRAFLRVLGVRPSDYRARFRSSGNQQLAA
jgi:transcriptional regulator GlxA family with amidase domain